MTIFENVKETSAAWNCINSEKNQKNWNEKSSFVLLASSAICENGKQKREQSPSSEHDVKTLKLSNFWIFKSKRKCHVPIIFFRVACAFCAIMVIKMDKIMIKFANKKNNWKLRKTTDFERHDRNFWTTVYERLR